MGHKEDLLSWLYQRGRAHGVGGVAGGKQSLPRKQGEYDRSLGDVRECGIKAIRSPW